jgi:MATE family multidrug resistance protein
VNAAAQLDFQSFRRDAFAIIRIGWPLILNNLFNISVNVADTLMVGRLGATQLAALSIGLSLWIGIFLTGLGVIMALGPTVSQHYGARRLLEIGHDTRQAVWLGIFFSILVITALNNVSPLLLWLGIEADVVTLAQGYLRGISIGVPGCYLYHVMRQMNEGIGRTVPIMVVMGISLVVNVAVSFCLVFGHLGLPALGVVGSGLGNGIAYWVSFLLIILHVSRSPTYRAFQLWQRLEWPDPVILKRLVALGGPIGLSLLMQAGLFTTLALLMGTLGKTYAAAHQIALNYAGLVFMVPLGIGFGTSVLVGQHIGAGDPQHARRIGITGIVMCFSIAASVAVFTYFAAHAIAHGYTSDVAVATLATSLLGISTVLQIGDGTQSAAASALRGMKDTRVPMLINGAIYWGIGFVLAWTLGIRLGLGAHGIWIGLTTALCVAAVVLTWRFRVVVGRQVTLWDSVKS